MFPKKPLLSFNGVMYILCEIILSCNKGVVSHLMPSTCLCWLYLLDVLVKMLAKVTDTSTFRTILSSLGHHS